MQRRHPPRPEKEKDETKETKSKEKRSQALDKETEKEAKREKKTIRRRKPTCESSSSASRRSLCRAWRREIRLDSEESWEGQNQRRN